MVILRDLPFKMHCLGYYNDPCRNGPTLVNTVRLQLRSPFKINGAGRAGG